MSNIDKTSDKIHEFSFGLDEGDFILIYSPITISERIKGENVEIIIPENTLLRIDNITMGGRYKRSAVDIIFSYLVKKNKHLKIDYKIPSRITIDVYSLNGLRYSIVDEDVIDAKVDALIRKAKIASILNNN